MTPFDFMALMPLMILAGGSVLVLLVGALRPGAYLYGLAGALIVSALLWSLLFPSDALLPGLTLSPYSRFFTVLTGSAALVALLFAAGYNRRRGISGEEYPATILFALTGMIAACAASNLLMLFLGLESFTFAFYILVAIKRDSAKGGEAGLKYLLNGTLSAAVLAMGMALVYAAKGTLKFAELSAASGESLEPLYLAGCSMMLLGMAFKLSLAPAHLWTADVYQGAPAPVTTLLSTASKAASLGALLLLLPLFASWHGLRDLLWVAALLSMVAGNLAALVQRNLKRMLAWSSVGQMGYVALALVAAPAGGTGSALFYLVTYTAAGLAAFGVITVLADNAERQFIDDYHGLGYNNPLAGAALALAMFSLAGIPPTGGFMGKFAVFTAALKGGEYTLALAGILTALVAVFFYLRVVVVMYMKPTDEQSFAIRKPGYSELTALFIPAVVIVALGLYPQPLLELLSKILQ